MSTKKDPRNKYQQQGHISDLLWHFIGPKDFENYDYDKAIKRLLSYFDEDSKNLTLEPYIANSSFYDRTLILTSADYGTMAEASDIHNYLVKEPKSVCFCDIPINSLPIHMAKYGDIGIGIRRNRVVEGSFINHVRPVLYYPHITETELKKQYNIDRFWKLTGNTVTLEDFVKIPTKLSHSPSIPEHQSEDFESIYEEREWRATKPIELTTQDIAYVIVPDDTYIKKYHKLQKLIMNGVGLIKAKDMYRTVKT
ncbi:abortive infection system antitoxin AbiGi family protein [Bdellovibrio sp. HCB209]|uniref:abortive infection system antitoxin AbiGi family protein n=1 Tax=Bdellovibrio sp. HCB209 TaxID=3394354 RepID=UPI0039B5F07C